MRDAVNTLDQERRKHDYAIVQEEIAAQFPAFFLWQSDRVDVLSDHFSVYTPSFDPGRHLECMGVVNELEPLTLRRESKRKIRRSKNRSRSDKASRSGVAKHSLRNV